mmetsp:Transcript_16236/g.26778  ORF Transcript_16236/g.26778 Transcript_16236/m.26778 type:complete len:93 (+) Transcript_16236:690-968(+)
MRRTSVHVKPHTVLHVQPIIKGMMAAVVRLSRSDRSTLVSCKYIDDQVLLLIIPNIFITWYHQIALCLLNISLIHFLSLAPSLDRSIFIFFD